MGNLTTEALFRFKYASILKHWDYTAMCAKIKYVKVAFVKFIPTSAHLRKSESDRDKGHWCAFVCYSRLLRLKRILASESNRNAVWKIGNPASRNADATSISYVFSSPPNSPVEEDCLGLT